MGKAERKKFIEEEVAQVSAQERSQKSETDLVKDAARRWESLGAFKKKLDEEGWMTYLGFDFCKEHWPQFLEWAKNNPLLDVPEGNVISPVSEVAESRRKVDGWGTECRWGDFFGHGETRFGDVEDLCEKHIFVPYP